MKTASEMRAPKRRAGLSGSGSKMGTKRKKRMMKRRAPQTYQPIQKWKKARATRMKGTTIDE